MQAQEDTRQAQPNTSQEKHQVLAPELNESFAQKFPRLLGIDNVAMVLSEQLAELERSEGIHFHEGSFEDVAYVEESEEMLGHLEGVAVATDCETGRERAIIFTDRASFISRVEGQKIADVAPELDQYLPTYLLKLENGQAAIAVGDHTFTLNEVTSNKENQLSSLTRIKLLPEPSEGFYSSATREQVRERLILEGQNSEGGKILTIGGREITRIGADNYRVHALTEVLGMTPEGMPIGTLCVQADDGRVDGFSNLPFFALALSDGRVVPVAGDPEESALIQGRLIAAFRDYSDADGDGSREIGSCVLYIDGQALETIAGEGIVHVHINPPTAEEPHPVVCAVLEKSGRNIPIDIASASPIAKIGEVAILPEAGDGAQYFFSIMAGQFDFEAGSGAIKFCDQDCELSLPLEDGKVLFTIQGIAVSDFQADLIHKGKVYGVGCGCPTDEAALAETFSSLQERLDRQFEVASSANEMFAYGPGFCLTKINNESIVDFTSESWYLPKDSKQDAPLFEGVAETASGAFFPICKCQPFTQLIGEHGEGERIETWYREISFNAQGLASGIAQLEHSKQIVVIKDGEELARFEASNSSDPTDDFEMLHEQFFAPKEELEILLADDRGSAFIRRSEVYFPSQGDDTQAFGESDFF